MTHSSVIAVRLKVKGETAVGKGHPWVFEDSVERVSKPGVSGDVAVLFDAHGKHRLGTGLYDPESPVRIKVLSSRVSDPPVGRELFELRLRAASERRGTDFPPPETDAWRMIHGESDSFPGLIADRYGNTAVLKIYSAVWFVHVPELLEAFRNVFPELARFVIRCSRELQRKAPPEAAEGTVIPPEEHWDGIVSFRENGIRFRADVLRGQKTGFFLDQRDNRKRVGERAEGLRVLNVFSFSGGFSLYAARGGASEVVSIDGDKHAIDGVKEHFQLNEDLPSVRLCRHSEITGDAFDSMRELIRRKEHFGMVIVDPPSFAKSSSEIPQALKTYGRLAELACALVRPGGLLVFASCSSRVDAETLFRTVGEHVRKSGRSLREEERTFHAPDHPARFRESAYLKCLYARIS